MNDVSDHQDYCHSLVLHPYQPTLSTVAGRRLPPNTCTREESQVILGTWHVENKLEKATATAITTTTATPTNSNNNNNNKKKNKKNKNNHCRRHHHHHRHHFQLKCEDISLWMGPTVYPNVSPSNCHRYDNTASCYWGWRSKSTLTWSQIHPDPFPRNIFSAEAFKKSILDLRNGGDNYWMAQGLKVIASRMVARHKL